MPASPDLPAALARVPPAVPVLLAGPTAAGKSGLALRLAKAQGRAVINADALQVHARWQILTARPGPADQAQVPHHLYGHVPAGVPYSVGRWLEDLRPHLAAPVAPVIVGGSGLYLSALTEGLSPVPPVPPEVRAMAQSRLAEGGLAALLGDVDTPTRARIDPRNPARVLRAWEVLAATGRGLAAWQAQAAEALLPRPGVAAFILEVTPEVLDRRIRARLAAMLEGGVLDEVARALPDFDPTRAADRAIGAAEFCAHLRGLKSLPEAVEAAAVATRRYAKRQRTWFRARMGDWDAITG
jgi:tRNA dimethylallyltransferase